MELLKYIRDVVKPYVRTHEILNEIDKKGLDADFVSIYNQLKAEGDVTIIPERILKWIEDIAMEEYHHTITLPERVHWHRNAIDDDRLPVSIEGDVYAYEIRQ